MNLKSGRTAGLGLLAVSIVLLMTVSSGNAATLNVVGGQLFGASGVIVDGASYDVAFLDGSCIDLYGGCDQSTEFAFTTSGDAILASRALIDQVFLDSVDLGLFDSDPSLTNGCTGTTLCGALTPYEVGTTGIPTIRRPVVLTIHSLNLGGEEPFPDQIAALPPLSTGQGADGPRPPICTFPACDSAVFAVWTPVPEPGTAILMGFGLLGLVARPRR